MGFTTLFITNWGRGMEVLNNSATLTIFYQLHIFIYSTFGFYFNLSTLLPGYTIVNLIWNLMTDLSWFAVAFLSGNQLRNQLWSITGGVTGTGWHTGTGTDKNVMQKYRKIKIQVGF
jgi:hypothetical protein